MINLEVKGQLAKLLATEDLIVEHRNVETAMFNVESRVLTLPRWDRASNTVFDLLISHEVGHALFTPNEDWTDKVTCPKMFVNVTEDARIESLMKRKYGGLPKTFYKGYKELYEEDFFGIGEDKPSEMGIADKVNLHFKIGNFLPITFTAEEQVVVDQIAKAVTFQDALEAAEALYALHTKQKEEKEQEQVSQTPEASKDGETGGDKVETEKKQPEEEGGEEGEGQSGEQESDGDLDENNTSGDQGGYEADLDSDKVKTMENVDEKLKDLINDQTHNEPLYLTHTKIDTDKIIISNSEVHSRIEKYWVERVGYIKEQASDPMMASAYIERDLSRFETNFRTFRKEIQPEVNYLVKEFECKKSADAYSRATTARTGVLDCTKLHTYKYNEDLFRKVTTIPEGKNHGLVFVLDWSGSMCEVLSNTMKQLLSLVMFCDKVGIPFDVYTFTNDYKSNSDPYAPRELGPVGTIDLGHNFNMVNILTSKVNRKALTEQMKRVYMIAEMFSTGQYNSVPDCMMLSGTPLNESILTLHEIIPQFQRRNGVQKVHTIILTDGEGAQSRYVKEALQEYDDGKKYVSRIPHHAYLRNRKTGVTRKLDSYAVTKDLLDDLHETFPGSTFTGFRILESSSNWFVRQAVKYDEKKLAEWKKNKSIALENHGYTKFFIIQSNSLKSNTEFDVDEGATKAKIKSSFAKSLKGKKNNKRILGEFVEMIA